jgi:3-hydroxyacyl-CoA dehydrogenase
MELDEYLQRVSIVGAAGKMGSGISLLLLQEMARGQAEKAGTLGLNGSCLNLIDNNPDSLNQLQKYLRTQLVKYAEKSINELRKYYMNNESLVSNEDIIRAFVEGALSFTRFTTELTQAKNSQLVFEAVLEEPVVKQAVYTTLKKVCSDDCYFLSNTSSIPISELSSIGLLGDRIIGFHFYNPPSVQKLVEIIEPSDLDPKLKELAILLGKRLRKTLVNSNDIAGFIGNGHFLREVCYACSKVREIALTRTLSEGIYIINEMTKHLLLRPMGIFQLIDYVGINVCHSIAHVMSEHTECFSCQENLLDELLHLGVKGGQYADGSQKPGFFKYEQHKIVAIYDLESKSYIPLAEVPWKASSDKWLAPLPQVSWKSLVKSPNKDEELGEYFTHLFASTSDSAELARAYLLKSEEFAERLIGDQVANSIEDVNTVMKNGFFHLYGPVNEWY